MKTESGYQFRIADWAAASNRLHQTEQWQAWAQGELSSDELPEQAPDVSFLPPLQRRRLGLSARLLFAAAQPLLAENAHCPLVLVSHDGEINRSFELWQSLLTQTGVSPTSFGLSVHNALAGQWSMLRGDMSEHTAIAAKTEALEIGVLEALGILADGAQRVLLAVVDEPLKTQYSVSPVIRAPFPYALAMTIEAGDDWQLSLSSQAQAPSTEHYWSALDWLRHVYQGERDWTQSYPQRCWRWSRK